MQSSVSKREKSAEVAGRDTFSRAMEDLSHEQTFNQAPHQIQIADRWQVNMVWDGGGVSSSFK